MASALMRVQPEDFLVEEQLGFIPEGSGEHAFLHLEKRELTTPELAERLSTLAGVHPREIGYSGMKDRNAVTRQWFSVGLAGRPAPDWSALEAGGEVRVLEATWHRRKLKRGVHRGNRFTLRLRELEADSAALLARLELIARQGVPNYFGEQRFGRDDATLAQAQRWMREGGRRISRNRRSIYLSALRSSLFNHLLGQRVADGDWDRVRPGDVCMLAGTHSLFQCAQVDADIEARCARADLHPALPLWGRGSDRLAAAAAPARAALAEQSETCEFLERMGLELAWRATRLLADDFCWQFCDDGSLLLTFGLGAGGYATALLAEFMQIADRGRQAGETMGQHSGSRSE
ncbi:tRNA pseudouridine(13) synthase TruD [Mangrovimicrobium sediminis]|uniref:tRNA pseudouridine synthase D n=1 Tax=Mangrovimicrobium sediminis TaxID=2562682 RepID=A0A4Z0M9J0_9GAMM|nr:tRNA pseudouridine(13) synthase TruD [Haliea sp. SAOS-164]TGD76056.1 tRNA pseudouridine(13) synthase TruD [Haliea sp. SAOS-164]